MQSFRSLERIYPWPQLRQAEEPGREYDFSGQGQHCVAPTEEEVSAGQMAQEVDPTGK